MSEFHVFQGNFIMQVEHIMYDCHKLFWNNVVSIELRVRSDKVTRMSIDTFQKLFKGFEVDGDHEGDGDCRCVEEIYIFFDNGSYMFTDTRGKYIEDDEYEEVYKCKGFEEGWQFVKVEKPNLSLMADGIRLYFENVVTEEYREQQKKPQGEQPVDFVV